MKTDLATSIIAAIFGVLIAYFVTNLFIGEIPDFSYTTIDTSANSELVDPSAEVFNYKALNPTVEVYVGECKNYDENGGCIDEDTEVDFEQEETIEIEPEPESQENP